MSRREIGFLLIGLGIGLMLSVVAIVEYVMMFHHMFVIGIAWNPKSILLVLPFVLVGIGVVLLFRSRGKVIQN
jgi:hypothetical protein